MFGKNAPSGMSMLIRSIVPEDIMLQLQSFDFAAFLRQIEAAKTQVGQVIVNFDGRLKAIEQRQARMESMLETLVTQNQVRVDDIEDIEDNKDNQTDVEVLKD